MSPRKPCVYIVQSVAFYLIFAIGAKQMYHCSRVPLQLTDRQPNNWNVIEPFTIDCGPIDAINIRIGVTKVKMASQGSP